MNIYKEPPLWCLLVVLMDFQARGAKGGGKGKGTRKHSSSHQSCSSNSSKTGGSKQILAPKTNGHGSSVRELPVSNPGLHIPSQKLGMKTKYNHDITSSSNDGRASSRQSEEVNQGQGNACLHTDGHGNAPPQAPSSMLNTPKIPNTESSALGLKNPLEPSHLLLPQRPLGPPLPEEEGRIPIKRPDNGGSSGLRSIELLANHFLVKYNEERVILHYTMDIQREKPTNTYETVKISKSELLTIKNKLFKTEPEKFPPSMIAYDGQRNLYTAIQLPVEKFRVQVHRQTYTIALQFNKQLELGCLRDQPVPREVLQSLNVIVREASISQRFACSGSLYSKTANHAFDLGRGITALEGSRQTLKCTEQGLVLRLEHSVMPFLKPAPVLQFLEKNLGISFHESMQLNGRQKKEVESALRGLQVTVIHRRTKQKFMVFGLTGLIAKNIAFKDDHSGKQVKLVEYYRVKHKVQIRFQSLPCLDLSKNQMNYVPMEFCELAEGQTYQKEGLRREEERRLRDMALAPPNKRKEMIIKMIAAADGPCSGELAKNFDIFVAKDMTQVRGRVLQHPDLRLRNSKGQSCKVRIQKEDCQWNLHKNKLLKGQKLDHWAIIDFSATPSHPKQQRLHTGPFIHDLVRRCRDLGIQIQERPLFVQNSSMAVLSNYEWLFEELSRAKQSPESYEVQLLICTMADRHPGYRSLKLICETELGIMTQCCLTFHVNNNQKKDQYLTNLALKINAKLGGTNVELFDVLPHMNNCPFMFIGADVNHPASWNTNSPSISAVVATLDSQASKYAASVHAQSHRVERIIHLGDMCKELVEMYSRFNGVKPEKIIYFRDGVSDGQFNMVLNEELQHLKTAIESDHYSPTITVVVAQKRHHTRLFPKDNEKPWNTRTGNVPPGTVVDTGIVDQSTFNFYLCSHYGSLGTSKPTHYHVLHDDHGFTSDELQRLIYNLCFTFARCTKPVSLVPPVYYADLMAYRGRLYYEGLSNLRSPASTTSSTSSLSSPFSILSSAPSSFDHVILPKLHRNVKDKMVFL